MYKWAEKKEVHGIVRVWGEWPGWESVMVGGGLCVLA